MSILRRTHQLLGGRPRGVLVAVVLVATLAITSLLAYQSVVEGLASHRATAERVLLHDYSAFAANRRGDTAHIEQELIYFGFSPALQALDKLRTASHRRTSTLPSPAELAQHVDSPRRAPG